MDSRGEDAGGDGGVEAPLLVSGASDLDRSSYATPTLERTTDRGILSGESNVSGYTSQSENRVRPQGSTTGTTSEQFENSSGSSYEGRATGEPLQGGTTVPTHSVPQQAVMSTAATSKTEKQGKIKNTEADVKKPGKTGNKPVEEKPIFSPEGRELYEAWCSIHRAPVPENKAIILAANTLAGPLATWTTILSNSLADILRDIRGWMYANDKNGYYKGQDGKKGRGIKLYDVARDFEGWQSEQERKQEEEERKKQQEKTPPASQNGRRDFTGMGKQLRQQREQHIQRQAEIQARARAQ